MEFVLQCKPFQNDNGMAISDVSDQNNVVDDIHEYFDPVMYRSVSNKEKNSNVNLCRRLIPIKEAFSLAQEEALKEDSVLSNKLDWIEKKLADIDISVRQVNINYAEQYDELVTATEKAISQLQQLSKHKLELLLGVEMELRREKEEIEWMEGYIDARRAEAPLSSEKNPEEYINFLNSWKSHAILRNGLSRAKPQEVEIMNNIKPDMVVHPEIVVSTEDKLPSTIRRIHELRKQHGCNEIDKDDEIQSAKSSAFNDCLNDAKHFFDTVSTNSGLYSNQPAKPLENLISPDAQALVNRNVTKIEVALNVAIEASMKSNHMMPLPNSITRPTVTGHEYPLPDQSHFESAYNEMGNNENYTDEQLKVEMEKNILKLTKNDSLPSVDESENEIGPPHRHSLADLRPLEQSSPNREDRLRKVQSERIRPPVGNNPTIPHINSMQSSGFVTAVEDFDGDIVAYLDDATEQYRPTYSLVEGAKRRQTQLSIANANFQLAEESIFCESEILNREQAEVSKEFKLIYYRYVARLYALYSLCSFYT